jgi:uroporphyrinogen-III synthase
MLLDRKLDVVTFTSPSAVRNLVTVLGAEPAADLLRSTVVAAIGPVTAEAAAQFDIHTAVIPEQFTVPALVAAIVKHFKAAV